MLVIVRGTVQINSHEAWLVNGIMYPYKCLDVWVRWMGGEGHSEGVSLKVLMTPDYCDWNVQQFRQQDDNFHYKRFLQISKFYRYCFLFWRILITKFSTMLPYLYGNCGEHKPLPSLECSSWDERRKSCFSSVNLCKSVKLSYREKPNWLLSNCNCWRSIVVTWRRHKRIQGYVAYLR